ncbi:Pericentriolar material 1 protein [Trichoplax sp. H2]|nr:Pericentriolar material 1 protein [Trichoplax sp. H2]|eukprot:RDD39376.1 Pericentriolar material 1 protein [Trichoplax sp. H2]
MASNLKYSSSSEPRPKHLRVSRITNDRTLAQSAPKPSSKKNATTPLATMQSAPSNESHRLKDTINRKIAFDVDEEEINSMENGIDDIESFTTENQSDISEAIDSQMVYERLMQVRKFLKQVTQRYKELQTIEVNDDGRKNLYAQQKIRLAGFIKTLKGQEQGYLDLMRKVMNTENVRSEADTESNLSETLRYDDQIETNNPTNDLVIDDSKLLTILQLDCFFAYSLRSKSNALLQADATEDAAEEMNALRNKYAIMQNILTQQKELNELRSRQAALVALQQRSQDRQHDLKDASNDLFAEAELPTKIENDETDKSSEPESANKRQAELLNKMLLLKHRQQQLDDLINQYRSEKQQILQVSVGDSKNARNIDSNESIQDTESMEKFADVNDDPELLQKLRLLQESRSRVARLKELIPESSESMASSQVVIDDEEENAGSSSIDDSLAISTEDPEIQEKLTKLNVAKKRLQKLKELMKIVQESSAEQLPPDLLQLTEELTTSNPDNRSDSSVSSINRPRLKKSEKLHTEESNKSDDVDHFQEEQLHKLQEKQEKLLHLKKVLEELKSSLSDSLNLPPAPTDDLAAKSDKRNDLALNNSNSALWGELRKRRELQEELKSKRKQLQQLLAVEKAKEMEGLANGPSVNGTEEVMGYGYDGATTQATWGGSTPDVGDFNANLEDDLDDGYVATRGMEEDSASSESNEIGEQFWIVNVFAIRIESDDRKEFKSDRNRSRDYRNVDNDLLSRKELLAVKRQYAGLGKQMDGMKSLLQSLAVNLRVPSKSDEEMYLSEPNERPNFGAVRKGQDQVYMRQLEMSNTLNQCLLQQMKQQQEIQEVQKQTNQLYWMFMDRRHKYTDQALGRLYSDSSLTSGPESTNNERSFQRSKKGKSHEDLLRRIASDRESGITSATDQSLFETLREPIYSEVAALISQNEDRPHFLIELFRELQQLTTDYLRQRAIFSLQDLTRRYLREDTIATREPQRNQRPWALSNATSEHTPSESIATIDDEEMQAQLGGRRSNRRHTQDDDISCLSYDYMEVVDSATSMATPPSNSSPYDLPFASDSLGDTIIHLDKALKEVRAVDERARRGTFTIETEMAKEGVDKISKASSIESHKRKGDATLSNNSSAYDVESSSSLSDVPYPRVNTQELDRRIHVILKELVPYIKEHSQESCSSPMLSAICARVLSLAQNQTENEEFARFFHRQLNSTLIDSLGKYIGRSMKIVAQEILVDISEILFNELAFFELMQDVDSHEKSSQEIPSYLPSGSGNQQYTSEDGNDNSEIDSETEAESAEDKPVDSVHEREVKTAVDMLSKDKSDQSMDVEMEELGKDRDDAMANQFEERSIELMQETEFIDCTGDSAQTEDFNKISTGNNLDGKQHSTEGNSTISNETITDDNGNSADMEVKSFSKLDDEDDQHVANTGTADFENDELGVEHLPSKLDVMTKEQLLEKIEDENRQNDPVVAVINTSSDKELASTNENIDPATFASEASTQ